MRIAGHKLMLGCLKRPTLILSIAVLLLLVPQIIPFFEHYSQFCHARSDRISRNISVSIKSLRSAAERGSVEAQLKLGLLYFGGQGVPQDASEAARWWSKAAEQGMASAQYLLGNLYFEGNGVSKDVSEAKRLWQKAADGGNPYARRHLAILNSKSDVAVQESELTSIVPRSWNRCDKRRDFFPDI